MIDAVVQAASIVLVISATSIMVQLAGRAIGDWLRRRGR